MVSTTPASSARGPVAARPFRLAVLRGLAVLCPPLLTVLIVVWAIDTTRSYLLQPVTALVRETLVGALADVHEDLPLKNPVGRTAELNGRLYHQIANGTFIPQAVYETVQRQPGEPPPVTGEGFYRRYVDLTYLRPYVAIPFFLAVFILLLYFLGNSWRRALAGLSAAFSSGWYCGCPACGGVLGGQAGHRFPLQRTRDQVHADRGRRVSPQRHVVNGLCHRRGLGGD